MSPHDDLDPASYQRLKDAAARRANRLRNEALWRTPSLLYRLTAWTGLRLQAKLKAGRRESAAPPAG